MSREAGFREVLGENSVNALTFPQTANAGTEEARKALADWLKSLSKPAAIFAAWDYPGVQALEICRAEKIKVPHDVAVIGVDNDPMVCDATTPPLSSIPFDYEKEGYESAAALIDARLKKTCELLVSTNRSIQELIDIVSPI